MYFSPAVYFSCANQVGQGEHSRVGFPGALLEEIVRHRSWLVRHSNEILARATRVDQPCPRVIFTPRNFFPPPCNLHEDFPFHLHGVIRRCLFFFSFFLLLFPFRRRVHSLWTYSFSLLAFPVILPNAFCVSSVIKISCRCLDSNCIVEPYFCEYFRG